MKKHITFTLILFGILCSIIQCKPKKDTDSDPPPGNPPSTQPAPTSLDNTLGFGLLDKIKGIWNGPVTSTTGLGSYPEWIVDFRPISENQISAKNELDTLNDIHMSFFVAKYKDEYRLAFRNGGSFGGNTRVAYFLADSVSESSSQSYYRFAEIIKGKNRAYTEVIFKNDSLIMKSYTNKFNTLPKASPHMTWRAKLQDNTSCQPAVANFSFPKKTLTKDFTSTFSGQAEAIYYNTTGGDPYPESDQPYLGKAIISYTYSGAYSPNSAKKVFLLITTQPLISGFTINPTNMKYRSRYVIVASTDNSFTFNYMHPGTYYLYAFYDADGNYTFSSGDWVSTTNTSFAVPNQGTVNSSTQLNFTIP